MSTKNTAALAAAIRRMRQRLKLTQTRFARELGVSQQKLSDWERGRRLRAVMEGMRLAEFLKRSR
jgi:DNA-binding transcriptional regulator YiaG